MTATAPQVERAVLARREFTQRELEVIRYLPTRLTNAEIGSRLQISRSTVKTHLKKIYLKLGVGCRNDAILVAIGWRLIPTDLAAGLELIDHPAPPRPSRPAPKSTPSTRNRAAAKPTTSRRQHPT